MNGRVEIRQGFPLYRRRENGERESRDCRNTVGTGRIELALASEGETVLLVSVRGLGSRVRVSVNGDR